MTTPSKRVCSMLSQSVVGWCNRPDYFDTDDLVLLADLAHLAIVTPDELDAAMEGDWPTDVYELVCELYKPEQRVRLWEFLKANQWAMSTLKKYEEFRFKEPKE
jgi:hypothetical protein